MCGTFGWRGGWHAYLSADKDLSGSVIDALQVMKHLLRPPKRRFEAIAVASVRRMRQTAAVGHCWITALSGPSSGSTFPRILSFLCAVRSTVGATAALG